MNITTKSLPRRTVLRGMGATLALPYLDAMVPALSVLAKAAAKPIHRFQAIYVPNGMAMPYWTPAAEGSDFELSPILEPAGAVPGSTARRLGAPVVMDPRARGRLRVVSDGRGAREAKRNGGSGGHVDRPDVREGVRGRRRSWDRLSSQWNTKPARGSAAPASAAPTPRRSRGAAPRSRCRWSTTRGRCSSGCLATLA